MTENIINDLKENVIQGRKTQGDEGIVEDFTGKPGVVELTHAAIEQKVSPEVIINEGLTAGMKIVGEKYSTKEYFIPDMLASAEAVGAAMDILKPLLESSNIVTKGKFLIATVKGDLHDIGKNIVAIMLKGSGYDVVDMGIDVGKEKVIDMVRSESPQYLGLSALLTTTMLEMDAVIKALKENNLRDNIKILIGGAAVSDEYAKEIGADVYCIDAFHAVKWLDGLSN